MKTQILLTVIFVLTSLFFIGCSDDLLRGKAKDIILEELDEEYSRLSGFYLTYDGARNRIEPNLNYLYISGHPNNEDEKESELNEVDIWEAYKELTFDGYNFDDINDE